MKSEHINVIGDILDSTYGKSGSRDGMNSVTYSMLGDRLVLKFQSIVHFAEGRSLQLQVDRLKEESVQRIKLKIESLKKEFKDRTGDALKLKEENSDDNLEVISGSVHSPRRVAYYRRNHTFSITG